MDRWDGTAFEYDDTERLKAVLVGRKVVNVFSTGSGYSEVLTFVLDDGTHLKAHAADGGCACSNGCFSVETGEFPVGGTILNVEVDEELHSGTSGAGDATIRVFVYTDLGKGTLIESEGGDNGYYGWGFWLSVETHWNGRIDY